MGRRGGGIKANRRRRGGGAMAGVLSARQA